MLDALTTGYATTQMLDSLLPHSTCLPYSTAAVLVEVKTDATAVKGEPENASR